MIPDESGHQDVFRSCLGRLLPVLVVRREACRRQRCHLDTDVEQHEVPGGDHQIHAQKRGERDDVILPLADGRLPAPQPFAGLHEDYERTEIQDIFHQHRKPARDIHSPEGAPFGQTTEESGHGMQCEKDNRQRPEPPHRTRFAGEYIEQEQYHEHGKQTELLAHYQEITQIHTLKEV